MAKPKQDFDDDPPQPYVQGIGQYQRSTVERTKAKDIRIFGFVRDAVVKKVVQKKNGLRKR